MEAYRSHLSGWARERGVLLPAESPLCQPNHHIFHLLFPEGKDRDACLAHLRAQGIQAAFHYVPLHSSPYGRTLGHEGPLPVTERVARTLLRLPLHPLLTEADVERVTQAVREATP